MKTLQRTLTIVKPDAVKRKAIGDIIEQFEKNGFHILSMKMLEISKHQAEHFYAVHASKPFFNSLTDFMSSGPIVVLALENHWGLTTKVNGLMRIYKAVNSPWLSINLDTGNAYLGGEDPYEGLKAVLHLLVHVHAKDISIRQSEDEKGKVTGTPVGCACGDGVINWEKVIGILRTANFNGVLSVECGTPEQAKRSLVHLNETIRKAAAARA